MNTTAAPNGVNEAVIKASELPVLPVTTQKVLGLMSDPDVSIEKIKRLVITDPGLATKILKVANSAFYGGNRNIQNLSQAILRLGLNAVRSIVVATSMKNVYKKFGLTEKLLWEQLIGSALASNIVARHTRFADPEDAFIGGLLHDVGKVVLNNEFPEIFANVMESVYNDGVPFSVAEMEHFGFTQRKVGAAVVKKWGFPESLEALLLHFDDPEYLAHERDMFNLVAVIKLSDRMCQKIGMGWRKPGGDEVDFGDLPEIIGICDEDVEALLQNVQISFAEGMDLY
ncbi:MAG: HDOD domain-containing protein [Thermodesulfobacteriota bacterium]